MGLKTKELRAIGKKLGRAELAKRALEIATLAYQQDNYKLAIECAGRMQAICFACKFDGYWDSKVASGFIDEFDFLEYKALQQKEPTE